MAAEPRPPGGGCLLSPVEHVLGNPVADFPRAEAGGWGQTCRSSLHLAMRHGWDDADAEQTIPRLPTAFHRALHQRVGSRQPNG
jgi:hypothetical protein